MTDLPNPFTDSGAHAVSAPDTAAAVLRQEAVAADPPEARFVLDEKAFMEAIKPPSLLSQKAG